MSASQSNVEMIVHFLSPVVAQAGEYEVFVHLSRSLLGHKLARWRRGFPLIEVALDEEELKLHVADRSSVRRGEPALSLSQFVEALVKVPKTTADRAIYYSTSFNLDEYTLTMNIPSRSLSIFFRPKGQRMLIALREHRTPASDA